MLIPDIFEKFGEIIFREAKIEAIKKTLQMKNTVIACGGGVVLNQINIQRLKKHSKIILLNATSETILQQSNDSGQCRPLLENSDNVLEKINFLLNQRKSLYEMSTDQSIDTTNHNLKKIVEEIIKKHLL